MAAKKSAAKKAAPKKRVINNEEADESENDAAPTPTAPKALTNRMINQAIDAGLPEMDEEGNEVYQALYGTYVRFIEQSPEKWELEKVALLEKLDKAFEGKPFDGTDIVAR